MITENQAGVIEFLRAPSTHGVATVDRVETHSSIVFLAGERAYKLKRAVRFDYLDFSTPDLRHTLCDAEVRLNRRTAPGLYRGVVAVTRQADGSCALGGDGRAVDWVVVMNRFAQEALFDRLARAGTLGIELMPQLASAIAGFHASAERRPDHGGIAGMRWVIDGNAAGFTEFGGTWLHRPSAQRTTRDARRELARRADLLERRRTAGFVRQCHGDLHLRNIVLLDGTATLFDGIEFNDEISCTDVLYDLAFLLMDLWRRTLPRHANVVWNRYMLEAADFDGIPLLPLFLSCRAAVRAKTTATALAVGASAGRHPDMQRGAGAYLRMAEKLLHPPAPCLVAVGGLSGAGKSTLAASIAPSLGAVPGALLLRSDEIRKRLCGVQFSQRLGPEGYTARVSDRVYAHMAEHAAVALRAGHSVIADAVHSRQSDRRAIEQVATGAGAAFIGLWLDAPEPVRTARASARRADVSDADAAIVRGQRAEDTPDEGWRRLDASASSCAVLSSAIAHVRERDAGTLNDAAREVR